jgi:hypothetical protein
MRSSMTRKFSSCFVLLAAVALLTDHAGYASGQARAQQANGTSTGEGHRQLGAHVHGQGKLDIAVEGGKLAMELEVPAADIVGFEHAARTKQQRATVASARAALSKPLALFRMPPAAGCRVVSAKVRHEVEGNDQLHGHGKDHDHGANTTASPPKKGDIDHAGHAEFRTEYSLVCKDPAAIATIAFDYFKTFGGAQALEVNLISAKGQTRYQVTRDKPSITLGGMM